MWISLELLTYVNKTNIFFLIYFKMCPTNSYGIYKWDYNKQIVMSAFKYLQAFSKSRIQLRKNQYQLKYKFNQNT